MHNCTNVLLSNFENGKKLPATLTLDYKCSNHQFSHVGRKGQCADYFFLPMTKETVCKQNSCTWERLFTPPQISRKYTVTSKYRWRMDKPRLSEEQNKATTVCYQPTSIMWNVQIVSSLRVIHITLKRLHDRKHVFVEPCSLVVKIQFLIWYRYHLNFGKRINVSTKVDCQSWSVRAPVMWLYGMQL